ncbi:small VCP/p97-interacting protein isoform X1 [Tachyglossus aculeatus]|uniref:small VCP/p97-interacting protein isoform X1 n=1 Tax=Tachyglossus aculeatus TaxID=9261 RepID=UPI0018F2B0FF|nr:small VCP/p97-interacting protein isoform X1 [Tachyglossus aculeatus]
MATLRSKSITRLLPSAYSSAGIDFDLGEMKRRQLAEAAEKRQMEASSRGIKNPYSVEQKKKKQEEMEKRMAISGSAGEGGGLRWQVG